MRLSPIALALAVFALILSGCGIFQPGPARTVESFYRSVEKGELEQAGRLLSSQFTQGIPTNKLQQVFAQQTRQIRDKGGITSIKVEQEEIIGETATVVVLITMGNGETQTQRHTLIKEGGVWKLDFQGK